MLCVIFFVRIFNFLFFSFYLFACADCDGDDNRAKTELCAVACARTVDTVATTKSGWPKKSDA